MEVTVLMKVMVVSGNNHNKFISIHNYYACAFRYSAVNGFAKAVLETNDLAGQRELVAEYLEAEVR